MQFCREYFCQTCSGTVTSPEEGMDTGMGSCIGVQRSQATAYTESQTGEQRDSKPENGSVLTEPPAAQPESDVLRFSEEEENRREEDKEELLFTDDLLPNIDLSSELNLWGSSFSTQVSEGEMKTEQVTLSSSPNPLLAGLHHYTEASPPAVVIVKSPAPDTSSCTGDPHLRGTPPPLHPQPQTPPDTPSDTPPFQNPLALMDRELQEAFQECEQHMASLLMPCPPAEGTPTREVDQCLSVPLPEDSEDEGAGTLRSESVKGGSELSPHPPEARTKQGRGEHENSGTQTAGPPTARREEETFSFRDYVLGIRDEWGEGGEEEETRHTAAQKQEPTDPLDRHTDTFTDSQTDLLTDAVKTQEGMTQKAKPDVTADLLGNGLNGTQHNKLKETEKDIKTGSQTEAEKIQTERLLTDTTETIDLSKEPMKDTKGMKLTEKQKCTENAERGEKSTGLLMEAQNAPDLFNQTGTQTQSDLPISTMPPRQALSDTLKETPTEAVAQPALDTTEQTRSGTNPATPTEPGAELLRESRDRGSVPAELQASSQLRRAIKMEAERDSVRETQSEAASASLSEARTLTVTRAESEADLQAQTDRRKGQDVHTGTQADLKTQTELQPWADMQMMGCDVHRDTQTDLKKLTDLQAQTGKGEHIDTQAQDLKTETQTGQGTYTDEVADFKRQTELQTQADTQTELDAGKGAQINTQVQDLKTPTKMALQIPTDTYIKIQMEIKEDSHTGCSGFQEQLKQQGEPHICPPLPDPMSGQDRVIAPGSSSAPTPTPAPTPPLPLGPQQPPADGRTGGPHHPVTGPETPHRNQPTREGSKNDKNAPATSVAAAEIDPRTRAGSGGGGSGEGAAVRADLESGRAGSRGCVGEEGAVEEASAAAGSALPLTTPTMPGMIECEGEEGRRAEAATGGGDGAVQSAEPQSPASADLREPEITAIAAAAAAAGRRDPSLISTETLCSPARKIEASGSEMPAGCCIRMPHNTEEERERGGKGRGGLQSHSPGTEREGEREPERACVRTDDHTDISPTSGLPGHVCQEKREEGTTGAGEGERKRVIAADREKRGGSEQQISSRQAEAETEGLVRGVVTDTATAAAHFRERLVEDDCQTGPPPDVGEPPVKRQHGDEIVDFSAVVDSTETGTHPQPIRGTSARESDRLPSASPLLHAEPGHPAACTEATAHGGESLLVGNARDAVITAPQAQETAGPRESAGDRGHFEKASLLSTSTPSGPSQPLIGQQSPSAESKDQQVPLSHRPDTQKGSRSAENSELCHFQLGAVPAEPKVVGKISAEATVAQPGSIPANMRDSVRGRTKVGKKVEVTEEGKGVPPRSTDDASSTAPGGCSSLPPLTVHESLRHPVTECSSKLQEFSVLQKQEAPVCPDLGMRTSTGGDLKLIKQSCEVVEDQRKAESGEVKVPDQGNESKEAKVQLDQPSSVGMETEKTTESLRAEEEGGRGDSFRLLPTAECQSADPTGTDQRAKVTAATKEAAELMGEDFSNGPSSVPTEKEPKVTTGDSGRSGSDSSLQETRPQASLGSSDSAEINCESLSAGTEEKPLREPPSAPSALCLDVDNQTLTDATTAPLQMSPPVQLVCMEKGSEIPEKSTTSEPETPAPRLGGLDPTLPNVDGEIQPWPVIRPPIPLLNHLELTVDCDVTAAEEKEPQGSVEEVEGLVPETSACQRLAKQDRTCRPFDEEKKINSVNSQDVPALQGDDIPSTASPLNDDTSTNGRPAQESMASAHKGALVHETPAKGVTPIILSQPPAHGPEPAIEGVVEKVPEKEEAVTSALLPDSERGEVVTECEQKCQAEVKETLGDTSSLPPPLCTGGEKIKTGGQQEKPTLGDSLTKISTEKKPGSDTGSPGQVVMVENNILEGSRVGPHISMDPGPKTEVSSKETTNQSEGLSRSEHLSLNQSTSSITAPGPCSVAVSQSDLAPPSKTEQQELGLGCCPEGESYGQYEGVGADACVGANEEGRDDSAAQQPAETQGALSSHRSVKQPGNLSDQSGNCGVTDGQSREAQNEGIAAQQGDSARPLVYESDLTAQPNVQERCAVSTVQVKTSPPTADVEAKAGKKQDPSSELLISIPEPGSSGQRSGVTAVGELDGKVQEAETLTLACEDKQAVPGIKGDTAINTSLKESESKPEKCEVFSQANEVTPQVSNCLQETGSLHGAPGTLARAPENSSVSVTVPGLEPPRGQEECPEQTGLEQTPAPSTAFLQMKEQSVSQGPAFGVAQTTEIPSPLHLRTGHPAAGKESPPSRDMTQAEAEGGDVQTPVTGGESESAPPSGRTSEEAQKEGGSTPFLTPAPEISSGGCMDISPSSISELESSTSRPAQSDPMLCTASKKSQMGGREEPGICGSTKSIAVEKEEERWDEKREEKKKKEEVEKAAGEEAPITPVAPVTTESLNGPSCGVAHGGDASSSLPIGRAEPSLLPQDLPAEGAPGATAADGTQAGVGLDPNKSATGRPLRVTSPVDVVTSLRELHDLAKHESVTQAQAPLQDCRTESVSSASESHESHSQTQPTSESTASESHSQTQLASVSTASESHSQKQPASVNIAYENHLQTQSASVDTASESHSQTQPTSVSTASEGISQTQPASVRTQPVSESTDPDGGSLTQPGSGDTNWLIQALRDAAAQSQPEQQNRALDTKDISDLRPVQPLPSPQAELEFRTPTEEVAPPLVDQGQSNDQLECRSSLSEAEERDLTPVTPPPPEDHTSQPSLPAYLSRDSAQFPTPPPTPPERCLPTPPPSDSPEPQTPTPAPPVPDLPPDSPTLQSKGPTDTPSAPSQDVPHRSSDSDGAFETPESNTPVKAAAPPLPPPEPDTETQPPPSEDTGFCSDTASVADVSLSEPVSETPAFRPPRRSFSTVFDEDKPIASSGAYNLDVIAAAAAAARNDALAAGQPEQPLGPEPGAGRRRSPLTRSLSLQAGDLDSAPQEGGTAGGGADRPPHLRAEAFSVETESAPGTLRKTKKPRPASLKKKPLPRQNSTPPGTAGESAGSTPELRKKEREEEEGGSVGPSPKGTLRKTKAPPKPDPQDSVSSREEAKLPPPASPPIRRQPSPPASTTPLPPVPDEESPILPKASYNWDPDNFEGIDPFRTGGSKVPNSPVLGRKGVSFTPTVRPAADPPVCPDEPPPGPPPAPAGSAEEQPLNRRQSVRLEFDYSEESESAPQETTPPPKKLGKKPGAKMPLRKPKMGVKKAAPAPTEQLDNTPPQNDEDTPIPKASYNFDPNKWEDPNFNPFCPGGGIPNSPRLSRPAYSFDPDSFDDSVDPFKPSNKMGSSPPKSSAASFEVSANDNDSLSELEDQNLNKPAKKKKTPIKSNTFRVKKSPKRSPMSEAASQLCPVCFSLAMTPHDHSQDPTPLDIPQDDHATDEEKLACSTNQKWATLHGVEAELTSDAPDYPQPSDLTAFVNENSLPPQQHVTDYEIEYMEKLGSSSPPLSVKKPSLYLKLDSVADTPNKSSGMRGSEPSSPCTGSFEEMEAQISAGGKSPVLSSRGSLDPMGAEKSRNRESESLNPISSSERDRMTPPQGPVDPADIPLLDRLSESGGPLQYLEPDLAETNPTAFAQKLQEELVLAALRIEALQVAQKISQSPSLSCVIPEQREVTSSADSVSKGPLYSRSGYSEGVGSSYLPPDLDHSLGIAREEIVAKEQEVVEWQRKYEESRQEVVEMRRIVAEYEKTIAQMIGMPEDEQREKSLSHHTIQQLILEKDQALADLNSVEKSLADLFRRYEKMKDVLEGFRKNEEVLKKCAQEYLSRVRKEEQRYQALKIHAEEKLDKANADIAQVRAKAKQEQAAYQASLRKEQMKVESLERTLEQKNKEIEELTKICDELISKMGKS
ncbi:transforming acidic coiled-coil-containing protein 2 isoform X3 [Anguilla anguilla]|uniref:transforming acidic coiled-coil-containing protein 2 isoform X3 n=1 Tax=Anguilla anguilla TaxID=7936 RepID=UPI0015B2F225|nr:transforming acidic coiled-coil-containing protein 2 isoform X3 [Anguilla anguilla]